MKEPTQGANHLQRGAAFLVRCHVAVTRASVRWGLRKLDRVCSEATSRGAAIRRHVFRGRLHARRAWLSVHQVCLMFRGYTLPKRSRRRRDQLASDLHRIEVERKALTSRILLQRADRLNVERPRRPALVNDQIALEYRGDWRFDPTTRLTYLTSDATQRVRRSTRLAMKTKFHLVRTLWKSGATFDRQAPF